MAASAISQVVSAYSVKGSTIARRVLSVGIAQRAEGDVKLTAAQVHEKVVSEATEKGIMLDRFSGSTCANAATSFDIYVASTLSIPTTANTTDGTALSVAGLIETARVKHGAKTVKSAVKVAVETFTEYTTQAERAEAIVEHLSALIDLEPQKSTPTEKSAADRLISALTAAESLAFEAELTDEQVAEALRLIESIRTTSESWA